MPHTPRLDRIVIVGAGLAALRCAERLRELGHTGTITVIGDEDHRPYNRPPLSKQLLAGKVGPQSLRLRTFTDPDATWRLGEAVVRRTSRGLPGRQPAPGPTAPRARARRRPYRRRQGPGRQSGRGWLVSAGSPTPAVGTVAFARCQPH